MDAGGVNVIVLPDDRDLGAELLLCDVLSGCGALVRVHEAHLEYVVLALGYCNGGCGRGQSENAVAVVLSGGSLARLGGYGAEGQLHAPVLQGVVGVDGLLCVVLVVLIVQLELNIAALSVDLVNRDLRAVLCSVAVNCGCAGQRAGAAELEGCAGSRAVGRAVCTVGAGGGRRAAAGQRRSQHCAGQKHTECLFHGDFSFSSLEWRFSYPSRLIIVFIILLSRLIGTFFFEFSTISDNLPIIKKSIRSFLCFLHKDICPYRKEGCSFFSPCSPFCDVSRRRVFRSVSGAFPLPKKNRGACPRFETVEKLSFFRQSVF